ncbi:MAG: hypothetical protein JO058_06185, partial [Alphaproteobacteria bacterium]|nr:hypothetical protein [Alphaproteobacteria bacterium]
MTNARILVFFVILLSVVWGGTGRAGDMPPSRVGQVSAVQGAVSRRPAGGEWAPAALNDPVIAGMALRTASAARATLGFGTLQVTLSSGSDLEVLRLDEAAGQIGVNQGRIGIHVARLN